jgi:hypothetical protein
MQTIGSLSPVKWAILGLEGGVRREFSFTEKLLPSTIRLVFGAVCFAVGLRGLRD